MTALNNHKLIIVRYSEVGLKGNRARSRMVNLLKGNITEGLHRLGLEAKVTTEKGRIYLSDYSDEDSVMNVLSRVMGVKSFSPVVEYQFSDLEDIAGKALELYREAVREKKFAVRSRRAGGQKFTSADMNIAVGDALFPHSGGVDLDNPEVEINIEARNNRAYFFNIKHPGPGGLPLGSEAALVGLVSGGIDSPVSAWMMMKRGSPVDFVFLSLSHPIDTADFLHAAKVLIRDWALGYDPAVHIIDGKPLIEKLVLSSKIRAPSVTYKRIMYRIAVAIAEERGAFGIVTGESLGQVSSQTPENLRAINHGIDFPVYRPLIGMDKDEISEIARRIGTFPQTSKGEFCSLFAQNVILDASPETIDRDMETLGDLVDKLVSGRMILHGSDVDEYLNSISDEDFEIRELPADSVIVDLRSREKFSQWHHEEAINARLGKLESIIEERGKDKIYVFYCQKGLQSAYAASEARNLGVRSYYTTSEKIEKMKRQ